RHLAVDRQPAAENGGPRPPVRSVRGARSGDALHPLVLGVHGVRGGGSARAVPPARTTTTAQLRGGRGGTDRRRTIAPRVLGRDHAARADRGQLHHPGDSGAAPTVPSGGRGPDLAPRKGPTV